MYISAQGNYKQYSLFQHSENKIYPNPNLGRTDYTCTYTLITYMCTDPVTKKKCINNANETDAKKKRTGNQINI